MIDKFVPEAEYVLQVTLIIERIVKRKTFSYNKHLFIYVQYWSGCLKYSCHRLIFSFESLNVNRIWNVFCKILQFCRETIVPHFISFSKIYIFVITCFSRLKPIKSDIMQSFRIWSFLSPNYSPLSN